LKELHNLNLNSSSSNTTTTRIDPLSNVRQKRPSIIAAFRYILRYEGVPGLFKGLVPNLVGVAPSRYDLFIRQVKHDERSMIVLERSISFPMQIPKLFSWNQWNVKLLSCMSQLQLLQVGVTLLAVRVFLWFCFISKALQCRHVRIHYGS